MLMFDSASEPFAASSPDSIFAAAFGTASSLLLVAPLNSDNAIISPVVAAAGRSPVVRVLQGPCEPVKFAY